MKVTRLCLQGSSVLKEAIMQNLSKRIYCDTVKNTHSSTSTLEKEIFIHNKTIKEINNMIESDELRGHIYVRTSNTKIAEFNPTQNNMIAEFDNLCTEKDSSCQEMFIYYFKVHKRRIFYTESRRRHLKLYDISTKDIELLKYIIQHYIIEYVFDFYDNS